MTNTMIKGLFFILFISLAQVASAAKTDVVIIENGDRLTGELQSMSRGKITYKTDVASTINLEWERISQVVIQRDILVETLNGDRHSGHIGKTDNPQEISIATSNGPVVVRNTDVVSMNPLNQSGWRDVVVNVSAGYNFAKANSVSQFNGSVLISQRTSKHLWSVNSSSNASSSSDNPSSQRANLGFNYSKLRPNRWLTSGILNFDTNDELDIALRTSLGGGIGRILRQTDHSNFVLQGGLLLSREEQTDAKALNDSVESYGLLQWDWFKFTQPDIDLSTQVMIIPSLTDKGRVRSQIDVSLSWKIIGDLRWKIDFYDSYDNQPQTTDASTSTNDYGVNTSVTYRWD